MSQCGRINVIPVNGISRLLEYFFMTNLTFHLVGSRARDCIRQNAFFWNAKCNRLIVTNKKIRKTTLKDIIVFKITSEKNMDIIKLREKHKEMQWINRCQ